MIGLALPLVEGVVGGIFGKIAETLYDKVKSSINKDDQEKFVPAEQMKYKNPSMFQKFIAEMTTQQNVGINLDNVAPAENSGLDDVSAAAPTLDNVAPAPAVEYTAPAFETGSELTASI
jgi:hypothetical protein